MKKSSNDLAMDHHILFYIVVPVFKAELFIEQCVGSVINQTYSNWQLILIDDGSPDRSGEICDKLAVKNCKIHVIHQENKGQIAARMTGVKHILAEKQPHSFVCFLDSDDTYEPHALQTIYENIEEHGADMVIFNWQRVYNGNIINKRTIYNGIITDKCELYNIVLSDSSYNALWSKSISISLIENIDYSSFFHIRHGEDLLQSLHYYKCCKKVVFLNSILYNYVINEASVTQSSNASNYCFNSDVRNYVWNFLKKENVWSDTETCDYVQKMQKQIEYEIGKISIYNIPFERKIELFKKIELDDYCKEMLSYPIKSVVLKLFLTHNYKIIIFLFNIKSILHKIIKRFNIMS